MKKKKDKQKVETLSDDEIETLMALIRLDLAGDFKLPDCSGCSGDAGCC